MKFHVGPLASKLPVASFMSICAPVFPLNVKLYRLLGRGKETVIFPQVMKKEMPLVYACIYGKSESVGEAVVHYVYFWPGEQMEEDEQERSHDLLYLEILC